MVNAKCVIRSKVSIQSKVLNFFKVNLIDNVCDSSQNQHGDQKGVFIITMIVIERNVHSIWLVVYHTQCIVL